VFDPTDLTLLAEALQDLDGGFSNLPATAAAPNNPDSLRPILQALAQRLQDNYPYPHPLYAGQMLKPPHPIARLGYMLAMYINPNNHALDGGRATSALEKECVADLAAMFGWSTHLGHLCGGGTMANLEALLVARGLRPGQAVLASSQAHYTHPRLSAALGIPFDEVAADSQGRMDIAALRHRLHEGNVGAVVATIGTTATGALDPLPAILELQEEYGFRVHADAAYGGYFTLADNLPTYGRQVMDALRRVDSICVDPHKHGLQPYGCGCILFQDPSVGRFYKHDSPYTYFTSNELHLGEISLECSRPGAAAAGLWATHRLLPPVRGGVFAANLAQSRAAALDLFHRLSVDSRFVVAFPPELDIVIWAVEAPTAAQASSLAHAIFEEAARADLHLAIANLPARQFRQWQNNPAGSRVACLRSCLMKPEHMDWLSAIWERLSAATDRALAQAQS
jgi:glutamate/tyrosine decarboxylase-like PLP-dependent enzyme